MSQSTTITVNGNAAATASFTPTTTGNFEFSLSVSPPTQSVNSGQTASYTVTASLLSGSLNPIGVFCVLPSSFPVAATCNFPHGNGIYNLQAVTLQMPTGAAGPTPAGTYPITIYGQNGATIEYTTFTLTVTSTSTQPTTYSVRISSGDGGSVSYSYSGNSGTVPTNQNEWISVPPGTQVQLTATPDSQHAFQSWTTADAVSVASSSSSTTLAVTGSGGVTAIFTTTPVTTTPVTPTQTSYSVFFSQSGLCCGVAWSVTLNGVTESSNSPGSNIYTIAFSEPNGIYSYTATPPSGFVAQPASGTITVNGGNAQVSVNFVQQATQSNLVVNVTPAYITSSIQLAQPVVFTASSSGGSGGYTYVWKWEQSGTTNQGMQNTGSSNQYTFTPPNAGSYIVWAVVTDTSGNTNLSPYTSVPVIGPQPANPTITVTPTSVTSGQQVQISGTGFTPNSQVYNQIGSTYDFSKQADSNGDFAFTYTAITGGTLALTSIGPTGDIVGFFPSGTQVGIPPCPQSLSGSTKCNGPLVFQFFKLNQPQGPTEWILPCYEGYCPLPPSSSTGYNIQNWMQFCSSSPFDTSVSDNITPALMSTGNIWCDSFKEQRDSIIPPSPDIPDLSQIYGEDAIVSSMDRVTTGKSGFFPTILPLSMSSGTIFGLVQSVADSSKIEVFIPQGAGVPPGTPGSSSPLWYSPPAITVVVGLNGSVTWTNDDSLPHTVTDNSGAFDSGIMYPSQSFTYTYTAPGTYPYHDVLHPWMTGMVIVSSPTSTSPTAITASTQTSSSTVTTATTQISNSASGSALTCTYVVSPSSGTALTGQFSVSCSGGSQPYSYHWSFGDGSTSGLQSSTHTYSSAGVYPWSILVIDAAGNVYSVAGTITIQ